jgi:hypothetical protein
MTSSDTRNTIYSKLDTTSKSIRLLELWSAVDNDEPLRCDLVAVSLDDLPDFEALSYMWGEPDDEAKFQIWVNGASVRVRQNLWYALQGLRFKVRRRILWIDALCINQDNIQERNHQVAFMGHIYRHATVVLIWLGNEISHAEWRVSSSNPLNLNPYRPLSIFTGARRIWDRHQVDIDFVTTLFDSRYQLFWEDVAYICALPYWQRLWIVQEICLASKIQLFYGTTTCSWDDFWDIVANIDARDHEPPQHPLSDRVNKVAHSIIQSAARKLALARGRTKSDQATYDLWTWINLCKHSECQDPRDKIYGLLSLAHGISENELEVDYSKSLYEVWEDVLHYYINHNSSYHSVVSAAEFLQQLLVGSLPGPESLLDMSAPIASTRAKFYVPIQGNIKGMLKLSRVKPSDLSLFEDGWVREQHQNESCGGETRLIALCWQSSLRDLWKFDHEIIATSSSRMNNTTHTIDENSTNSFALFCAQSQEKIPPTRYIGIGPGTCRDEDILFCFQGTDFAAILRFDNGRYNIIGRALVSKWNSTSLRRTRSKVPGIQGIWRFTRL